MIGTENVLEAKEVTRIYGSGGAMVRAVDRASFSLARGELVGLSGPSGCGKSTLLNIAGLCDRPSSGQILLRGAPADFGSESSLARLRRSSIGYVFQYFNLLPTLSAIENVALAELLNGREHAVAEERARAALERLGLSDRCGHMPSQLSGGQMQRVAVARAVVHTPLVVLADEPTGNLDSAAGEQVLEILLQTARAGTAVLIASHNNALLSRCDRVLEMRDGRLAP